MPDATSTSTLSDWAAPYVTDMLGRAEALSNTGYQTYDGQRVAPMNTNQNAASGGIWALNPGMAYQGAQNTLAGAGAGLDAFSFNPTQVGSTYQAPGAYGQQNVTSNYQAPAPFQSSSVQSSFQAPQPYQTGNFGVNFNAPASYTPGTIGASYNGGGAYQAGTVSANFQAPGAYSTGSFSSGYQPLDDYQTMTHQQGTFDNAAAQRHMNPYIQQALEPTLREIQRQADIQRLKDNSRMSQAGAFGGSRQAILEAENNRNALQNISDTQARGMADAFEKARAQHNTEEDRGLDIARTIEQSRQFGYGQKADQAKTAGQFRLDEQKAGEQSRQFGYDQQGQNARFGADLGLRADVANEQNRQAAGLQSLQAARDAADISLRGQEATERSRQFGATYGLDAAKTAAQLQQEAQRMGENSRQFGATLGLDAARIGAGLDMDASRLNEQSRQFGSQLAADSARTAGQLDMEAALANQRDRQFGATQAANTARDAAGFDMDAARINSSNEQAAGRLGLDALTARTDLGRTQASVAAQGLRDEMDRLRTQFDMGTAEQRTQQAQNDADYQDFLNENKFDYDQLEFMRDMISGMPISTQTQTTPDPSTMQNIIGSLSLLQGTGALDDLDLGSLFGSLFAKGGKVPPAKKGKKTSAPSGIAALAINGMG